MQKLILSLFLGLALLKPAAAEPASTLVVDAATGEVLQTSDAGAPWYPASLTKMMTAYVTLKAIENKRFTFDHVMRVSPLAARQAPSKMGFKAGSLITVENALKIIMVKSANDVSMTIAEGVSGSLPAFVKEMNQHAQALGMSGTHFVNANGLPGATQKTTARDMALLARALLLEFPNHRNLWDIPAIEYKSKIIRNTNHLIGRYPNVMGMKTGFICASGFNVVAAASRGNRVLIVVVLGAHSAKERAETAAKLFEAHFSTRGKGSLLAIANQGGAAPSIAQEVCKRRGKGQPPVAESAEYYDNEPMNGEPQSSLDFFRQELQRKEAAANRPMAAYALTRTPEVVALGGNASTPSQILGVAAAVKPAAVKPKAAPKIVPKPVKKETAKSKEKPKAKEKPLVLRTKTL